MKIAICIILHIQTKINKIPTVHVKTEGISDCRQNGFRGYTLKPFCCNISNYENHLSIK